MEIVWPPQIAQTNDLGCALKTWLRLLKFLFSFLQTKALTNNQTQNTLKNTNIVFTLEHLSNKKHSSNRVNKEFLFMHSESYKHGIDTVTAMKVEEISNKIACIGQVEHLNLNF